jgi:hypothetical protein
MFKRAFIIYSLWQAVFKHPRVYAKSPGVMTRGLSLSCSLFDSPLLTD